MKNIWTILLIISVAMFLFGCGDDSKGVNPDTIPETGSQTLIIDAKVKGKDAGAGLFTTSFQVDISDSLSVPVTDASVTISHPTLGITNLVWDTLTANRYTASVSGYLPGLYTLDITRGAEFLFNGRVAGPDIHTITYPTVTDTIPLNTGITTLWSRLNAAELVEVETRDYGPVLSSAVGDTDDGSFDIPGSQTVRNDQFVRITRSNEGTLTGGFTGSTFKASIRNSVEPIVVR